ncbi:sulfatase [Botryobacter ruber]|uniref:sulfatase n=1 Tax=Botryobacter ruber TaxID=2171629 RepID=UPI000E09F7F2|nr:sulfatase [Botryobacter ruber]
MTKNRIVPLLLFLGINLLLRQSAFAQKAASSDKPNIVLIFADDLGFMDVGFNGADYYETPHIDKLAKEGMRFTNAYASGANCAPSRACMISGLYNPRHGVFAVAITAKGPTEAMRLAPVPNTTYLKPAFFTMAKALKSGGYTTGQFGKWHIGDERTKTMPDNHGFDIFKESDADWKNRKVKATDDPKGIFGITQAACDFISANKNKPFFAFVSHHAVHGPHQARPESLEKFKSKKPGKYNKDPMYAACIYDFDASVGQLLAHLKKEGLDKNTLVVFTSDNGGAQNTIQEPLRGNKGSFYEGGIREPFIVRWPGHIKAGAVNETPITNIDFYPTFVAAANVKLPANTQLDGENLLPLFTGQKTSTTRDKIFWHFPGYLDRPVIRGRNNDWRTQPVTVMRKGDYKVMLYHEEWQLDGGWDKRATNNAVELYNLKADPGEHHNIAASNPAKRDEMLQDLQAWMKATKAPMATIKTPQQEREMTRATGRANGRKGNKARAADDDD